MSIEGPFPEAHESAPHSLGRVLAAIWLVFSQAIFVGVPLAVLIFIALLDGAQPFSGLSGDPTFGFLSGMKLKTVMPLLIPVVVVGTVLSFIVGSWKLWARRKHGWAVLVSSLPLLLFALIGLPP